MKRDKELIPCKLFKQLPRHSDFLSMNDASICQVGGELASTITARYYKGIGNHHDNMVMEIWKTDYRQ